MVLPAVLANCPATQVVHAVQLSAFVAVLNEPEAQGLQVRFIVVEPAAATMKPAGHEDHATHAVVVSPSSSHVPAAQGVAGAVSPGQTFPARQGVQLGFAVVEPGAVCTVPGGHGVHAVHKLAGFASSSHSPAEQAIDPELAPAQYVPGTHATHCTGLVGVAGTVSAVPGAHEPAGAHALEF